ncbi:MAG: hypothetical protein E7160_03700 [Firmicutes bacterium]|nr:hypothetical protein [Bacillota bacterium]
MAKSKNKKKNNNNNNNKPRRTNNINKVLEEKIEILDEDDKIFETRQQEFDFGDLDLTSTLDTSFTSKKGSNEIKDESEKKFDYVEESIVINKSNMGTVWILGVIILLLISFITFHFITFNHHKVKVVTKIKEKVVVDKNYLFLGDSITDYYDLDKYYEDLPVVNSGISGNVTNDILDNMKGRVYKYNPSKVFLLIGTNDLQKGKDKEEIVSNIRKIIENIKENRSYAEVYLESIYPVDEEGISSGKRKNKDIREINKELKEYCSDNNIKFIDMYKELVSDEEDNLNRDYTEDGLHLNDAGYEIVTGVIKKYLD